MKKFICGVIFASIGLTILDNLSALIQQSVHLLCTKIAAETQKIEQDMINGQQQQPDPCVIGFQHPNSYIEEEYIEEDKKR
jgi:hypothetical protein